VHYLRIKTASNVDDSSKCLNALEALEALVVPDKASSKALDYFNTSICISILKMALITGQYDNAVAEKQRLTDDANVCLRKMTAATALINGLGGEKIRWTEQSKDYKLQLGRLVGDVLLATGFLSYSGPYNQYFRANLITSWMDILMSRAIPFTQDFSITNMLVDTATISEWTLQGLPNDGLSVQNALIVTKSSSYPLLVDPQSQGKMWIKNKEMANELQITSLNHKYFRTHLEDSLSLGESASNLISSLFTIYLINISFRSDKMPKAGLYSSRI
jgi:hypothetical protein